MPQLHGNYGKALPIAPEGFGEPDIDWEKVRCRLDAKKLVEDALVGLSELYQSLVISNTIAIEADFNSAFDAEYGDNAPMKLREQLLP